MSIVHVPIIYHKKKGSIMRIPPSSPGIPIPIRRLQSGTGRVQRGNGIFEDIDQFLRDTHIISTVTGAAIGTAGSVVGGALAGPPGAVAGAGVGAGLGSLAQQGIYQAGYGRRRRGRKPGPKKRRKNKKK